LRNLLRQPFRTFLILQGVIWGTALGVVPPAVINGSLRLAESKATRLGTDRLLMTQDRVDPPRALDWSLIERLRREHAGLIRHATAMAVLRDPAAASPTVIATDEGALEARGMKLARGRFFTAADVLDARPMCVLEDRAAQKLFGSADPLGRSALLD